MAAGRTTTNMVVRSFNVLGKLLSASVNEDRRIVCVSPGDLGNFAGSLLTKREALAKSRDRDSL